MFREDHLCGLVFFKKCRIFSETVFEEEACNFIKKETLAQVFPCEFCEISKYTFLYRTSLVAASDHKTAREQVLNARAMLRYSLLHEEKLTNS